MDRELFESYVMEAAQLRQQVNLMLRIINNLAEGDGMYYSLERLQTIPPAVITIEGDEVNVDPR
jgi:hypothetical protein